jgi:hypothetical protein
MSREQPEFPIISALFHTILFAYQKSLRDILGSGQAIFVHPVIETLRKINEERQVNLIEGKNIEEAFENLSKLLVQSGTVKVARFEKLGTNKYKYYIDGCILARPVHKLLNPEDVTCPPAILAMSIFEEVTGRKVKFAESKYSVEGTETIIEPL